MAAPTFLDADPTAGNGGNATSVVFHWSNIASPATDDFAVVFIYKESTAAYTATPANWTQLAGFPLDQDTGGFKFRTDVWWRRYAGDSGNQTWSWTGSTWCYSEGHVWRGAYTAEMPLVTVLGDEEATQNQEPTHPGITIARSNSGLLWAVFNFSGSANTTTPTGFAYRQPPLTNNREILVYDDLSTVTGASGTITGDLSDPEWSLSVALELATEAGGGAPAALPLLMRPVLQAVNRAANW